MGKETGISWTHSTFNPWRGCQRVSPGCENCYAETLSKRNHALLGQWGPPATGGTRVIASPAMWREPVKWNAAAAKTGQVHRVFCSSLADVFEDLPELEEPRAWLWELISATSNLTWMLLTKRPQNVVRMVPNRWLCMIPVGGGFGLPIWPRNVWIGTTVEDQQRADERIPHLLRGIPRVAVKFLSVEPQLTHVDLTPWLSDLHWVIQGGESGPGARPFDLEWADSLRAQCAEAGVAYFFKQMGARPINGMWTRGADKAGADPAFWEPERRVQQFPGG